MTTFPLLVSMAGFAAVQLSKPSKTKNANDIVSPIGQLLVG
jgi:hypothetical protein